jgi:hypothetical protein
MSFLTPLYIAGLLAVSLPVVFHLIRRTPQGEAPFSSLMFLSPSPPRITRRSRVEHWLLLALRGLALALLAAAFARPFWREAAQANAGDERSRRVAIVVDTSASMQRGELWSEAVELVEQALGQCRPQDVVGVFACDETLRPIAGFEDLAQVDPGRRGEVVLSRLEKIEPGWAATHLGQGLVDVVAELDKTRDATADAARAARRIVLVSDMQSGSRLQVVGDYPWPADVELELRPVVAPKPSNAGLARLADAAAGDAAAAPRQESFRIRVANAQDSAAEQFRLQWADAEGKPQGDPIAAYVPAGESRVVRVPQPSKVLKQPRLALTGDDHDFDNTLFVVPRRRDEVKVAYLGDDGASDPQGLQFYLERALASNSQRDATVERLASDGGVKFDPAAEPELVVVTKPLSPDQVRQLRDYMSGGGTLAYVTVEAGDGDDLAALLDVDAVTIEEAQVDGYAMLGDIDFDHPLFASMAGPRFNDFTQIRFWKYRRLELPEAGDLHVIARFESGDPAIVERRLGKGRLLVMTAGWHPADGQLARSWKFLLMLSSLIDDDRGARALAPDYHVNERVRLPDRADWAEDAAVTRPGGGRTLLADDAKEFTDTAEPGIYALAMLEGPAQFAVNLDPAESDTAPLPAEVFEQLGCRLAGRTDATREAERLQQLRDVELESRQKLWQWLVAATLGVLVVETWLAGRLARPAQPEWTPA